MTTICPFLRGQKCRTGLRLAVEATVDALSSVLSFTRVKERRKNIGDCGILCLHNLLPRASFAIPTTLMTLSMYLSPTPKQHELITLIYRFRFLNRIQLQTLLHHKDKRRINSWLKELTEQKYLGRIYSTKLLENTKPAIYYLSHAGILYLRDRGIATEQQLKKYYEDNNRSQRFIEHCIFLGTIYLQLLQGKKVENNLKFLTRADFSESESLIEIHPSAYYTKSKAKHYFIELFDEGMPRYAIRGRIRQYIQFYWSATWEQETKAKFPAVLLISPTEQIQRFLWKFISKTLEEEGKAEDLTFSLTTNVLLETQGIYRKIWRTIK